MNLNKTYRDIMKKARKRVEEMDRVDGSAMSVNNLDLSLRTIMSALESAISCKEWHIAGDAMVMLSQLESEARDPTMKGGYFLDESK